MTGMYICCRTENIDFSLLCSEKQGNKTLNLTQDFPIAKVIPELSLSFVSVRSLGNDGVEVDKIFSKLDPISELFCPNVVVSETFKVNIEPSFSCMRSINSSKNVKIL